MLCAGFCLCCGQFAAVDLVASLRASLASLGSAQFVFRSGFSLCYVAHLEKPKGRAALQGANKAR